LERRILHHWRKKLERKCNLNEGISKDITQMFSRFFSTLTHVNKHGHANMVSVHHKQPTVRTAVAIGKIWIGKDVQHAIQHNLIQKGDVLSVARIAGIQSAKQCSTLIPLCHPLKLSSVSISFDFPTNESISIKSKVTAYDTTGVEMEALTAVSTSCLTIYDMCKAMRKNMRIECIQLDKKTGGKSGNYSRK